MKTVESIEIRRLGLVTRIGVPDEEREEAQTLRLTVKMTPLLSFRDMGDDISGTVDYAAVAAALRKLAADRPRKLIETLAHDIAAFLLDTWPLRRVEVSLEKYILPDTEAVAVHLVAEAA